MDNNDLTAIVTQMPAAAVEELLQLLADTDVQIVRPPRSGLVMRPLIDSFQAEFNLGEVLVTEAGDLSLNSDDPLLAPCLISQNGRILHPELSATDRPRCPEVTP